MISKDDLRAAVGSGLLSEAQAASLSALADSRRGAREGLSETDEPFELFRGFNEIFIIVGLLILASGWVSAVGVSMATGIVNYQNHIASSSLIAAAVLWALSEYFIRRRRMIGPAITLAIMFAVNASIGLTAQFAQVFMVAQEDYSSLLMPVGLTTAAVAVYWLRFRVPFAMALIALGMMAVALILGATHAGTPTSPSDLFLLSADGTFAWITLAVGVVIFIIAMYFDMSDPHRVTLRSSQGFWLHVVAAPALVNTIALTLLSQGTAQANLILFAVLIVFALVAIIIDRRSFLIAAIGYSVTLSAIVFDGTGAAWTVLLLGVLLLILGAFWARIRAAIMATLGGILPRDRLPPCH
ncbi:hypothetical protein [Rhodalgimonas zhirmunskyi]|uniref:DUF2157 domain-containing protein n=1 Tax=Rhodalgimonas zhirmunskyi TaxID=2964767 RepID=A0AAJ1UDY9_9RHOB|nr:hypothetical protein [Rhodoalgimonas zhirmunskyi]MDQ2094322.1 hypothetical protein [Rhodoalgimonas zhirmunskyi]